MPVLRLLRPRSATSIDPDRGIRRGGASAGDDADGRLGWPVRLPDRWRAPGAVHDPGKIVADLPAAVAVGEDCIADIAVLREQPELSAAGASDPVVARLVTS